MELVQIVDLLPECYDEYVEAHKNVPVKEELAAVGLSKIRVYSWHSGNKSVCRLVLSATWEPAQEGETFKEAMKRYMTMPGVAEWEAWMDRLKMRLPGQSLDEPPLWERCECVYSD